MNKRTLIIPLLLMGVASLAAAQTAPVAPQTAVEKPHHQAMKAEKEILAQLDLNATQMDQVKSSMTTLEKGLKDLKSSEAGQSTDDLKVKRKALHKTYMESLKSILTPTQMDKYKALHKEMRKKAQEAKAAGSAPKPL